MTTIDVLSAMRRRWYVAAVAMAGAALAMIWVTVLPGVYSTQVDVVFIPPPGGHEETAFASSSSSLIAMAGLVEREVNHGTREGAATAAEVTLVGMGVHHGSLVLLPNTGGQWNYNFSMPLLSVQAVGSSPEEVRTRRDRLVGDINKTLHSLQAADGTEPDRMITTRSVPASAPVAYENGHRAWAVCVIAMLGLGVSAMLASVTDRWLSGLPGRRWRVRPWRGSANVV
jgi:hypothetical protein